MQGVCDGLFEVGLAKGFSSLTLALVQLAEALQVRAPGNPKLTSRWQLFLGCPCHDCYPPRGGECAAILSLEGWRGIFRRSHLIFFSFFLNAVSSARTIRSKQGPSESGARNVGLSRV